MTNTDDKDKTIAKLKQEIASLKRRKRFGLVFEEKPEAIVNKVNDHIPYLVDREDKSFVTNENNVTHELIKGDNYAALLAMLPEYRGKIDVIYIDPPYNTGNNDFIYNDNYIDKEDGFRHSTWLSFMQRRLKLAKEMLSDSGVIFVSIDDNEQAHLKILMDEIFGEENFVENFMWLHGKGKKTNQTRTLQQYNLCYAKNRNILGSWSEKVNLNYNFSNPDNDPKGDWFSGSISFSEERSNSSHPNYYSIESPSGKLWRRQWMVSKEEMNKLISIGDIFFGYDPNFEKVPRLKIRRGGKIDVIPGNILENLGTTRGAQKELSKIFNDDLFSYPKPVDLMKHLIKIPSNKSATVLDFFAGSGTTGHAVAELNAEDGGNRKCILVTDSGKSGNAENTDTSGSKEDSADIAEDITYERLRRVFTGEDWANPDKAVALNQNLAMKEVNFLPIVQMVKDFDEDGVDIIEEIVLNRHDLIDYLVWQGYEEQEAHSLYKIWESYKEESDDAVKGTEENVGESDNGNN